MNDAPGFFTGSGMPMRFADLDGTMIDVYQATTQMTDESGQTYPFTIDTLLDRALGSTGYYGAFTANIHTDGSTESQAAAIVSLGEGARRPRGHREADAHLARRAQRLVVPGRQLERRRADVRHRRRRGRQRPAGDGSHGRGRRPAHVAHPQRRHACRTRARPSRESSTRSSPRTPGPTRPPTRPTRRRR